MSPNTKFVILERIYTLKGSQFNSDFRFEFNGIHQKVLV